MSCFFAVKLSGASAQGCRHHSLVPVVNQSVFTSKHVTVWIKIKKRELTKKIYHIAGELCTSLD